MSAELGARILDRLKAVDLSQAELARRVGITQPAINHLIKRGSGGSAHLHKIARELRTTPEYLTGETNDPEPYSDVLNDRQNGIRDPLVERSDDIEIAMIDLRYGMGGTFLDESVEVVTQRFPRSWVRMLTDAAPENLFWARGQGNSMSPTIDDGEIVLIDRGQSSVRLGDLVYAVAYGDIGMIKRLRPLPDGSVEIHSDNPTIKLPPARAVDGELHVIGRVVGVVKNI